MTNLIVAFRNFVTASKNAYWQKAGLYRLLYNSKTVLETKVNRLKWIHITRKDLIRTPKKTLRHNIWNPSQIMLYCEGIAAYFKDKKER
jgi:hypothetical protein